MLWQYPYEICGNATYLFLYTNIMSWKTLGAIINYLKVKSSKSDKIIFLAICTNSLSHVQNCVAVIICVDILWKQKIVSINYLLRYDTDFHNIMIVDLFKCICVNG